MARVRRVGSLGDAGEGGGDTGDGEGDTREPFSRVRSPASRHRKLFPPDHREHEPAREARARPAYEAVT